MKRRAAPIFYGGVFVIAGAVSWFLAPLFLGWSPPAIFGLLATLIGAIAYGEMKSDAAASLNAALGLANAFKTREQVDFNAAVGAKIRQIRTVTIVSHFLKALAGVLSGYLISGSGTPQPLPAYAREAIAAAMGLIALATVCFLRLWMEVNNAERLLVETRQRAQEAEKRKAFLAATEKAPAHDFDADPISASYGAPPVPLFVDDVRPHDL